LVLCELDLDLDNNCQTPTDIAAMVWACPTGVVTSLLEFELVSN